MSTMRDYGIVGGYQLDAEQLECIKTEAHNHLVIAGAGTGKTTTIIGRIKYLLETHKATPGEICALVYNRSNAEEMRRRILQEVGSEVKVATFHSFGNGIIGEATGKKLSVPDWVKDEKQLKEYIGEIILKNQKDDRNYRKILRRYLNYSPDKTEFDFTSREEFEQYKNDHPMMTMAGENVKSYGELEIANYLTSQGICYEYEREYEFDVGNAKFSQYKPDFYLPEYRIYIEYFGINHAGEVPVWFSDRDDMSATEAYQHSMKWKRKTHQEYGTTLLECYGYEKMDGILSVCLERRLAEYGVEVDLEAAKGRIGQVWQKIQKDPNSRFGKLCELFVGLIETFRTKEITVDDALEKNRKKDNDAEIKDLLDLFRPVFEAYNQRLRAENAVDFTDMIICSRKYVERGAYTHPYKYVIIDEYQDLSDDRYKLIKALRNSKDFDLFCVGDDWQGINGFSGAKIDYILDFEKYWGETETSYIQTTYRFSQSLAEVSGKFIMKNPSQLKKTIKSCTNNDDFALEEVCEDDEKSMIYNLSGRLETLPKSSKVFLLGRYRSDLDLIRNEKELFVVERGGKVLYKNRKDLDIEFWTVHTAKGQEADFVFILNNKNTMKGFPSQITDLPIIRLLNDSNEEFPMAEERRVYYVALTRAKVKTCILTLGDKLSDFVSDLRAGFEDKMIGWRICPECGDGRLKFHCGAYGAFYGCSNYNSEDVNSCRYRVNLRSAPFPKRAVQGYGF